MLWKVSRLALCCSGTSRPRERRVLAVAQRAQQAKQGACLVDVERRGAERPAGALQQPQQIRPRGGVAGAELPQHCQVLAQRHRHLRDRQI